MWRRHAARVLMWSAAIALAYMATHSASPYLIAVRGLEWLLLGGGGLVVAIALRRIATGRMGRREGGLLIVLFCTSAALTAYNEMEFRRERREVLAADASMRLLGQHFIVGYKRFDEVAMLAQRGLIGGVYVSRANVHGRTITAIRAEIDALQALREKAGLPPLIVAADQEGGTVAHMTPPLAGRPSLASLVEAGNDAGLDDRVRAYAEAQGRELAALGINLNFGPVADLRPKGTGPRFDTHTQIRRRAIAADPAVVERVVVAYDRALLAQGVHPTLKHFPGLGEVMADTHHFAARLEAPVARLTAADWRPFRAGAREGAAIMLAHVVLPEIDATRPASLSPTVVGNLLRKKWNYDGLLVTDDLNMGAVYRLGIGKAAAMALEAGADMVLVSYDPDQYYRAMSGAADALRHGVLDEARLAESRRRIAAALPGHALLRSPV